MLSFWVTPNNQILIEHAAAARGSFGVSLWAAGASKDVCGAQKGANKIGGPSIRIIRIIRRGMVEDSHLEAGTALSKYDFRPHQVLRQSVGRIQIIIVESLREV